MGGFIPGRVKECSILGNMKLSHLAIMTYVDKQIRHIPDHFEKGAAPLHVDAGWLMIAGLLDARYWVCRYVDRCGNGGGPWEPHGGNRSLVGESAWLSSYDVDDSLPALSTYLHPTYLLRKSLFC